VQEDQNCWQSVPGQNKAKGFLAGPSAERTDGFLKLSRFQARQVTGLSTEEHCHLSEHLFKWEQSMAPLAGGAITKQKRPCMSFAKLNMIC
jgi:hypothetical protein